MLTEKELQLVADNLFGATLRYIKYLDETDLNSKKKFRFFPPFTSKIENACRITSPIACPIMCGFLTLYSFIKIIIDLVAFIEYLIRYLLASDTEKTNYQFLKSKAENSLLSNLVITIVFAAAAIVSIFVNLVDVLMTSILLAFKNIPEHEDQLNNDAPILT